MEHLGIKQIWANRYGTQALGAKKEMEVIYIQ